METRKRPDLTLDEALKQAMRARKIGTQRFRLPVKDEDAYRLMMASYAAEVENRCQQFIPTDETLDRLWQMNRWLTSDSSKFGLCLCGGVGNGKTTMLYAFQSALNFLCDRRVIKERVGIQIVAAKEICQFAKRHWERYEAMCRTDMLAIDEVGEEPREVLEYGNVLSPIIDLIEQRYARQQFTMMTSNLSPKEISEAYGTRIADRLREMVEIVSFGDTKSFRGQ